MPIKSSTNNHTNHISVSITEGRIVRDLLFNGFVEHLKASGNDITLYSEANNVTDFTGLWRDNEINFAPLLPYFTNKSRSRAFWTRKLITKYNFTKLLKAYCKWEEKTFYPPHNTYLQQLKLDDSKLLLTTNAHLPNENELISSANELNIPTLGFIKSWDNIHKGIHSRPKWMAVWNEINKEELIELEKYSPENIFVTGPPQFDKYFEPDTIWSQNDYFTQMNLDPNRPTIFYATIGDFGFNIDETYWIDLLLDEITKGNIKNNPQIICRLHPWSKLQEFQKYNSNPNITISYMKNYWTGLGWYMNTEEVIMMANMLHHSNLVISPGSTVILEAAIFDKPTIFPIFHDLQPERAAHYFNNRVLIRHFKRIQNMNLVPILDNSKEFAPYINEGLNNPKWYFDHRKKLVSDYVGLTDGQSTKRLANLVSTLTNSENI